jgi:succinate dehydrogenase hydrophobic anchor subunit
MQGKPSGIKPARIFAVLLVIFAVPILTRLIENIPITATQLGYFFLNGAILTVFLAWLIPKMRLSRWSLTLLVWLELLVVEFLNNYVEAYFFTTRFSNPEVLVQSVASALISSLISATAAALLLGHGISGITASLKEYLSTRTSSSWILRIAVGSVAYFPTYFFFGLLIIPFVLPYYNDPSFGLRIPSFAVIIPVELFRGFVYTLVLLPLLATVVGGRTTKFIALATMLYIPGGLIALLGNPTIPAPIIPFHGLEILADSIVYGLVLSRVLSQPR